MRILVTGGAGFIGSNFIRHILNKQEGHQVVAFDDLSTGRLSNLNEPGVEFVEGTLADMHSVSMAAEGADAIVHLGALGSVPRSIHDPVGSHVANLTGTLNVLEAARKNLSYVVFASSSSVYGANKKLPKSELDWTRPVAEPIQLLLVATRLRRNSHIPSRLFYNSSEHLRNLKNIKTSTPPLGT